jgi:RND family efflux transporter MFP subunit
VVKKGDLLFEIEDTRYKAAVEEAVAKKAQLEAKLLYAKNSFERYNRLLASKSVSMDTVENAKSTMHALEAEIQSADAAITVAKDDLNYTKLTAPITGRTGRVTFSTGNYITPTSGSLVTITGIDEVYVKFPISERDFLSLFGTQEKMKKDALVSVNLANGKAYDQPGKIFMTDNTVQPTTDTLNVWARFPNPEDVLTPGGVVTVNLSKKNVDRFPAANISSVMHDAYKSYVYVVNDQGVVERRDVTLGNTVNNEQCFSSGVKEGEVIIIDGMHKVRPGAKVNPVYSAQN